VVTILGIVDSNLLHSLGTLSGNGSIASMKGYGRSVTGSAASEPFRLHVSRGRTVASSITSWKLASEQRAMQPCMGFVPFVGRTWRQGCRNAQRKFPGSKSMPLRRSGNAIILAHQASKDSAQFRIELLDGKGDNTGAAQRLRNRLLAAMGLAGYGTRELPKGEGMGVACVSSQERKTVSWTACVAHVAVSSSGEVKVKKLTMATDVGTQVHPDNIRAQVEGAALWGLSLALYEKATLANGGIEQTNFDSYTPLRMSQMPEVAGAVIANGEHATGVGEHAVTVIAPAIGNAVYNASGARVRGLPITAEAVKAAMKA
jgi:CO/xanthine dehydrogenase Mo-binding subunit